MNGHRKVGFKARHGRHKRNPLPHRSHRKASAYSRAGRRLKQRVAMALAPKVSDFDLDRPRLGLSERQVAAQLRPQGDVIVVSHNHTSRASTVQPASPMTTKAGS